MAYSKAYIEGFRKAAEDASVDPDLLIKAAGIGSLIGAGLTGLSRAGALVKKVIPFIKKIPGVEALYRGAQAAGSKLTKVKPRTWVGIGAEVGGSAIGSGVATYMLGRGQAQEQEQDDTIYPGLEYMQPDYLRGFGGAGQEQYMFGRPSLQLYGHPMGSPSNFVPYIPVWQKRLMQKNNMQGI